MSNTNLSKIKLKLILLGESSVGKTSLLLSYTDNYFPKTHVTTIGVELKEKEIIYKDYQVTLQIWDTAGQERYRALAKSFFKGAQGILFVYDITSHKSFDQINKWIKDAQTHSSDFQSIIIGNKCDLKNKNVSDDELNAMGNKKNMPVMETSAKDRINVDEAFLKLVEMIIGDKPKNFILDMYGKEKKENITLEKEKNDSNEKGKKKWKLKC